MKRLHSGFVTFAGPAATYGQRRCRQSRNDLLKTQYRLIEIAVLGLTLMQVGACASAPGVTEGDPKARSHIDPWEPLNRGVYAFNNGLDTVSLRPVSKGYKKVAPAFIRRGISNFFANLRTPLILFSTTTIRQFGTSFGQ